MTTTPTPAPRCPACGRADTEYYIHIHEDTGDGFECVRCRTAGCGRTWGLDPGAHPSCPRCAGSGLLGLLHKVPDHRAEACDCVGRDSAAAEVAPVLRT